MELEWDEAKDAANLDKHDVRLSDAARIDWDRILEIPDARRDYGETRIRCYAYIGGRLHLCVYTWRDGARRIISLRKANPREERRYAP